MGAAPKAQDVRKDKTVTFHPNQGDDGLQSISCGPTGGSLSLEDCDLLFAIAMPNLPIGRYEVGSRHIRS